MFSGYRCPNPAYYGNGNFQGEQLWVPEALGVSAWLENMGSSSCLHSLATKQTDAHHKKVTQKYATFCCCHNFGHLWTDKNGVAEVPFQKWATCDCKIESLQLDFTLCSSKNCTFNQ